VAEASLTAALSSLPKRVDTVLGQVGVLVCMFVRCGKGTKRVMRSGCAF